MLRAGPALLLLLVCCSGDAPAEEPAGPSADVTCGADVAEGVAVTLGRAAAGSKAFEPLQDGDVLPVFDGTQGVVATWLVVRVAGGAQRMRLQVRVTAQDGTVLASSGALLTPFVDVGCGAWLRPEHMVPFDAICCAKDYDGMTVDVTATVVPDGQPPVGTTLRATLELAPFPL